MKGVAFVKENRLRDVGRIHLVLISGRLKL